MPFRLLVIAMHLLKTFSFMHDKSNEYYKLDIEMK